MKCILMPSLVHIALVKIVSTFWNQEHVKALIMAYVRKYGRLRFKGSKWQIEFLPKFRKIENTIMVRVLQLKLPRSVEDKVINLIKPIGIRIGEWIRHHYETKDLPPVEFCWTQQGTVDQKRTAQMFVKNENLDISKRYEWACFYCLEEDIPKLWMKMPDRFKQLFLKRNSFHRNNQDYYFHRLVYFWTKNMTQRENYPSFSYQSLFECSVIFGNKAATEYLLARLTTLEREHSMVKIAESISSLYPNISYDPDILCFLLSEMHEEKQMEFLKSHRLRVLELFLDWPFQSLFIETVTCMSNFLEKNDYCLLLIAISRKHIEGFKDWNYQKLWGEFWGKGSLDLKSYVINGCNYAALKQLMRIEDKENCRLMLKDVAAIEKKKLIHCDSVQDICLGFLSRSQFNSLEFFIHKCLLSKDEMLQFKEELEKRTARCDINYTLKYKRQWDSLFCLSDNSESEDERRTVEERQSTSSTIFRSLCM